MVRVLVQLKLTLQRRAFGRGGLAQRLWSILTWLLGLVLGIGAAGALAVAGSVPSDAGNLLLLMVFTAVFLGWLLFPILVPASGDQTIDPALLEQYPLTARQQVSGLLVAGLVAPTALFTFLLASGPAFEAGETVFGRLLSILTAVLFVLLCVASSRSVAAALSGLLRTRKGRDIAIGASGVLVLGVWLLSQNAQNLGVVLADASHGPTETILALLPPGAVAEAMLAARDGEWARFLLFAVYAAAWVMAFLALWGAALRRRVKGETGGATRRRRQHADEHESVLLPPVISLLPAGPTTAAMAQQTRYYFFRSPRATQSVALAMVIGAFFGFQQADSADSLSLASVFVAVMVALMLSMNLFGYDARSFPFLVAIGAPMKAVIRGKAAAAVLILIPLLLVYASVQGIRFDAWEQALTGALVGLGAGAALTGVGAVASVRFPFGVEQARAGKQRAAFAGLGVGLVGGLVVGGGALALESAVESATDAPLLAAVAVVAVAVPVTLALWSAAGRVLQSRQLILADQLGS